MLLELSYRCNKIPKLIVFSLKLSMLVKKFSRRHFKTFFLHFPESIGFDRLCKFSPRETIRTKYSSLFYGFDISCELSPEEKTICMKCQRQFA